MKVIVIMPANYILTGNLNVTGDAVIAGTVYDIKSLSTLVKLLARGDYKDLMELTNNERITIRKNLCFPKENLCFSRVGASREAPKINEKSIKIAKLMPRRPR